MTAWGPVNLAALAKTAAERRLTQTEAWQLQQGITQLEGEIVWLRTLTERQTYLLGLGVERQTSWWRRVWQRLKTPSPYEI